MRDKLTLHSDNALLFILLLGWFQLQWLVLLRLLCRVINIFVTMITTVLILTLGHGISCPGLFGRRTFTKSFLKGYFLYLLKIFWFTYDVQRIFWVLNYFILFFSKAVFGVCVTIWLFEIPIVRDCLIKLKLHKPKNISEPQHILTDVVEHTH